MRCRQPGLARRTGLNINMLEIGAGVFKRLQHLGAKPDTMSVRAVGHFQRTRDLHPGLIPVTFVTAKCPVSTRFGTRIRLKAEHGLQRAELANAPLIIAKNTPGDCFGCLTIRRKATLLKDV